MSAGTANKTLLVWHTSRKHVRRQGCEHLLSIDSQGTDDPCQYLDGIAGGLRAVEKGLDRFLEVFIVCTWKTLGMP